MKTTYEMKWLAFRIEWHWLFIMQGRKRCGTIPEAENFLSSPKLLTLNKSLSRHCMKVMQETKRYNDLAGLSPR